MTPEKFVPLLRDVTALAIGGYSFVWSVTHGANIAAMSMSALVMLGPAGAALLASWSGTPASPPSPPSPSLPRQRRPSRPSSSEAAEP